MKVTAYDWISNLRESVPVSNVGLNKRIQKKFGDVDIIDNATSLTSDIFLREFEKALSEEAAGIDYKIDHVPLTLRNDDNTLIPNDSIIDVIAYSSPTGTDDIIELYAFVGQEGGHIFCCPIISKIENVHDNWHKRTEKKVLKLKGSLSCSKLMSDPKYKEVVITISKIYFKDDKFQDFVKRYYIENYGLETWYMFLLDDIAAYSTMMKKLASIFKDLVYISNEDAKIKSQIETKINDSFEIV